MALEMFHDLISTKDSAGRGDGTWGCLHTNYHLVSTLLVCRCMFEPDSCVSVVQLGLF